jgi:phosphate:Na+ symporter
MAGFAREMFARSIDLLERPDEAAIEELIAEDQKLDILERAIRPFLAQIAQGGLDPVLSAREHAFIYLVQDLEAIGDIITKELAPAARKLAYSGTAFSGEGMSELKRYHSKLAMKLDRVLEAIEKYDRALAEQVLQLGFKERMLERKLREKHLERLHTERKNSVETSTLHMSVLNNLRGIGEKLDDMARTILEEL